MASLAGSLVYAAGSAPSVGPVPAFVPTATLPHPPATRVARTTPAEPPIRGASRGFLLAEVGRGKRVLLRASPGGPVIARLGWRTEFRSQRVLSVAARRGRWLGVTTPEAGNGRLGWVNRRSAALRFTRTAYSLRVSLSRRLLVMRRGRRVKWRMPVTIGRPGADTPRGRFAVTDRLIPQRAGHPYGCCVFGLSGRQTRLPSGWSGGNRLAIHGTRVESNIGGRGSLGCLRGRGRDLRVLMRHVPLGTPVFIRA